MQESFSQKTKTELSEIYIKHKCCKNAFLYGLFSSADRYGPDEIYFRTENESIAHLADKFSGEFFDALTTEHSESLNIDLHENGEGYYIKFIEPASRMFYEYFDRPLGEIFMCGSCERSYLRGVFCSCGTVTEPGRGYHLEMSFRDDSAADALAEQLRSLGLSPKKTYRKGRSSKGVYFKESEAMEDFLNYIGAQKSAFELMNVKIYKDLRNNANRYANCDAANIDKTVQASRQQIDAIERLIDSLGYEMIPEELHQTVDLRIANPDSSLAELAEMHRPPITKSGVSHRLKRIMKLAQDKR